MHSKDTVLVVASFLAFALRAGSAQETESQEDRPVVVTASRLEEPIEDVASSISVIDGGDLEKAQHRRVLDALREVPALDVVQTGSPGGITSVFMRGANSGHTLVLIDGVEANDAVSGDRTFDFAHLGADNIDRIEVLRGPQSVLYGSDGMGGVINVLTRRGRGEPRLRLYTEAGTFGTYRAGTSMSGGTDLVHYSFGASRSRTDGISAASRELGNSEKDGYDNSSISARIGLTPTEIFEMDLFVRVLDGRTEIDSFGGAGGDDPNRVVESTQWLFRAAPRLTLFDGLWEQTLALSLTDVARADDDPPDAASAGALSLSSFDSQIVDVDWQHNFFVHETVTLTAGLEFEEDEGESTFHFFDGVSSGFTSVFGKEAAWTRSAYGQVRIHLWDEFTATAGGRVDDHERFGTHGTFRATAAYFVDETKTKVRGTVGTGFKAPTLFQLFSSFGNPTLEPEESLGWDVGVDQELFEGRFAVSATYFRNDFEELVEFDLGLSQFVNLGEVETSGVETAARIAVLENLQVRLSYTYTNTEDQATGQELIRRVPHKGGARVLFDPIESVHLNGSVLVVGERQDTDFGTGNRVDLEKYVLVGLAAAWRIDDHFEVFARGENLLDEEYEEVFGFGVPGAAGYIGASISF